MGKTGVASTREASKEEVRRNRFHGVYRKKAGRGPPGETTARLAADTSASFPSAPCITSRLHQRRLPDVIHGSLGKTCFSICWQAHCGSRTKKKVAGGPPRHCCWGLQKLHDEQHLMKSQGQRAGSPGESLELLGIPEGSSGHPPVEGSKKAQEQNSTILKSPGVGL